MTAVAPDRLVAPTFLTHPPFEHSLGDMVADFSASLGFVPDPEQRLALQVMYAQTGPAASYRTMSPRWSCMEFGIIAPRQNLKSGLFKMAVLADLFLLEAELVTWSAHLFKTSRSAFIDIKQIIEANAGLSKYVRAITEGAGNEGVVLTSGARLQFMTRSKTGGRGLTGEKIILDEALMLTDEQLAALLPTLSAIPNPMLCYGSSPGLPGESDELRRVRDRGRAGDSSLGYLEWSSQAKCATAKCSHEPGTPGCIGDDEDEWAKTNTALDRRISREYVRNERMALKPATFLRERLGVWPEMGDGAVVPAARWSANATTGVIEGPVAVFVDVQLDRARSVIAVCGADGAGVPQVELVRFDDAGTANVAEKVEQMLAEHDVLAGGARNAGPVASLLPELREVFDAASVPFTTVGAGEFAGQCGAFFDAIMTGTMRHRDDERLSKTLHAARRHKVVDSWSWERVNVDTDAAPLVAVTGAYSLFVQRRGTDYDVLSSVY